MRRRPDHDQSNENQSNAPTQLRLQRFLASAGLGSRRHCEEFITAGRVTIDGKTADDLGVRVDPRQQTVRVDGEIVRREPIRYYVLNKPRGYLCTNSDPAGRPRAIDLVPQGNLRLFTVGRLDEGSEGLILVTNDGDLAHRMAHPRFEVPRVYRVQVAGKPGSDAFETLRRGVHFTEGRFHFDWIRKTGAKGNSTFLEIGMRQGRNREIRRLFARVGHKVMRLCRVSFGPVKLGRLPGGAHRTLTDSELKTLREMRRNRSGPGDESRRTNRKSKGRQEGRPSDGNPSDGNREQGRQRSPRGLKDRGRDAPRGGAPHPGKRPKSAASRRPGTRKRAADPDE